MAILPEHYNSSTLPTRSGVLLGCRRTTVSHSFLAPRGTPVNFELLREAT